MNWTRPLSILLFLVALCLLGQYFLPLTGETPQTLDDSLLSPLLPLERATTPHRTDEERFLFEQSNQESPSEEEPPTPRMESGPFRSTTKYHVILDPGYRTKYFPQVQVLSPVVKLNVKTGDSFKKGDLILQMDQAKFLALRLKTKSSLEKAQEEFKAKERLYKDGNASYFDYLEAQANLATAEAELVFAEKNLEATEIIAPYDGKLASLSIEEYELPLENKEMMELIHDEFLIGKILLPSKVAQRMKVGDPLEIFIDETQEKVATKISRIASVIEPSSSTIKIEAQIDNSSGRLMPGMSGYIILK